VSGRLVLEATWSGNIVFVWNGRDGGGDEVEGVSRECLHVVVGVAARASDPNPEESGREMRLPIVTIKLGCLNSEPHRRIQWLYVL
jgi:hypothetical protein